MPKQILLIKNSSQECESNMVLQAKGYLISEVSTLKCARLILKRHSFALVILEVSLPDGNGVEFVKEIKQYSSDTQIIFFTNNLFINNAVQAIKYGAFDYIIKDGSITKLVETIEQAMEIVRKKRQNRLDLADVTVLRSFDSIIGTSKSIETVRCLGQKVSATNTTVLLLGETGVGKDVMAEAIHSHSSRSQYPFVAINCSAIGQEMLESELFGYKAGAFTGAMKDKKGLFEEGNNGTIFLDEIGDMNLVLQSKILRVLENKSFIKMGDTKTSKTDSRIIAATHVDLLDAVKKGRFREDLYYRISSFVINIPPLRERLGDIPALSEYFVKKIAQRLQMRTPKITDGFIDCLINHNWPGNIRELINILERSIILSNNELTSDLLDLIKIDNTHSIHSLQSMEQKHINNILNECLGNKRRAAKELGISIATLYKKMGLANNSPVN